VPGPFVRFAVAPTGAGQFWPGRFVVGGRVSGSCGRGSTGVLLQAARATPTSSTRRK
jgi:hypothetical protein